MEQQQQEQQDRKQREDEGLKNFIQEECPFEVVQGVLEYLCGSNDVNGPTTTKTDEDYSPFMKAIKKGDYSKMVLIAEVHPKYFPSDVNKGDNDDDEKKDQKKDSSNDDARNGDDEPNNNDNDKDNDDRNTPTTDDITSGTAFDINKQSKNGMNALLLAMTLRKPSTMKYLIHHGSNVDIADAAIDFGRRKRKPFFKPGATTLHYACIFDYDVEAQILIDNGADVDAKDDEGMTPLHVVCGADHLALNHLALTKILLESGADANAGTNQGIRPLHFCYKFDSVLKLLVDYGADMDATDSKGVTPLALAIRYGNLKDTASILIQKGADVNLSDTHGNTPLHTASYYSILSVVDLLLERGADIDAVNEDDLSPLFRVIAESRYYHQYQKYKGIIEFLIRKGAKTDCWMKAVDDHDDGDDDDDVGAWSYTICSHHEEDGNDNEFAAKLEYCNIQSRYYLVPVDTTPWKEEDDDIFEILVPNRDGNWNCVKL